MATVWRRIAFRYAVAARAVFCGRRRATDKTVESLTEFFKEVDGMRTPVRRRGTDTCEESRSPEFSRDFETTGDMAGQLADLVVYALPETFFNRRGEDSGGNTADVQRIANGCPSPRLVVGGGDRENRKPFGTRTWPRYGAES